MLKFLQTYMESDIIDSARTSKRFSLTWKINLEMPT
jgi:hypothetical protein